MVKTKKVNKNQSKLFGIVINPKLDERMNWESLSSLEVGEKLKEMKFLNKFLLTEYLNNLEVENVSNNLTGLKDFSGQLELGTESKIPHYQLAIEMKSICTKKKVLEAFEGKINGHVKVDIQFNLKSMKDYCTKESKFISEEYSGKIYKHEWDMNFLNHKSKLKEVLESLLP